MATRDPFANPSQARYYDNESDLGEDARRETYQSDNSRSGLVDGPQPYDPYGG